MIQRGAGKNLGRYAEAVANLSYAPMPTLIGDGEKDAVNNRIAIGLSVPAARGLSHPI